MGGWRSSPTIHAPDGQGSRPRAFWDAAAEVYRALAPELLAQPAWQSPRRPPYSGSDIRRSGLFGPARRQTWGWRRDFAADAYLALLDTYSDHRALPARRRGVLLRAIGRLIAERFAGVVPREYETLLYLAPRARA